MNYQTEVQSTYRGGLNGHGKFISPNLESVFSAPKLLGGSGMGTNPEELLAAAAGSCFLITLGAVFQFQAIEVSTLELLTEVSTSKKGGLHIETLHHTVQIILPKGTCPENETKVRTAVAKAETLCLVNVAVKGNVRVQVTPHIRRDP